MAVPLLVGLNARIYITSGWIGETRGDDGCQPWFENYNRSHGTYGNIEIGFYMKLIQTYFINKLYKISIYNLTWDHSHLILTHAFCSVRVAQSSYDNTRIIIRVG